METFVFSVLILCFIGFAYAMIDTIISNSKFDIK